MPSARKHMNLGEDLFVPFARKVLVWLRKINRDNDFPVIQYARTVFLEGGTTAKICQSPSWFHLGQHVSTAGSPIWTLPEGQTLVDHLINHHILFPLSVTFEEGKPKPAPEEELRREILSRLGQQVVDVVRCSGTLTPTVHQITESYHNFVHSSSVPEVRKQQVVDIVAPLIHVETTIQHTTDVLQRWI